MQTSRPDQRLRVAHLNARAETPFDLAPGDEARAALAAALGIEAVPALRFSGAVRPERGDAWALSGQLQARVVQPCVVTLEPVETAIDEPVERLFSPHLRAPEGEEVEMPDETVEPLGQWIDLGAILEEALALALPLYPRAAGVAPLEETEPETEDDRQRPFAGLADLMGRKPD